SMDHPGPIGCCVADLELLFQAIVRPSFGRHAIRKANEHHFLLRFRGLFQELAEPGILKILDEVCRSLENQRAEIEEVALPSGFSDVLTRHRTIMAVEAA